MVEDPRAYLARLRAETLRLSDMVDDLLALSRLQATGRAAAHEVDSVTDVASDVVAQLAPVADAAGVALDGRAEPSVEARGDVRELTRAVANLVGNALRHTPAGGGVEVAVTARADLAVVGVADACGGIPADHLPHVFEAGWRGAAARGRDDGAGAGLGLAIVHEVARSHGGSVTVRNRGPGCVFELQLPLADEPHHPTRR